MTPTARRVPHVIALFGLFALAVFTWIERGPSRALQWPWHLYAQLLAAAPALWFLAQGAIDRGFHRFGGALEVGLLGFAGAMALSALTATYQETSLAMLAIGIAPVTLAYGINHWIGSGDRGARRRALADYGAAFLVVGSLIALAGWAVAVAAPRLQAGDSLAAVLAARNEWLLGHTVYTAGLALLCTTWLGGLAFERTGRARGACLLGATIGLVLLFTAGSRSGFIGLAIWSGWLLLSEAQRRKLGARRTAALVVVALIVALGIAGLHPRSRQIVQQWREAGAINMGDRQRMAMAEFGAIALRESPWLGFGPGTTPLVYPTYRAQLSGGVESALQLHSTPIQWVADAGLLGLGAAALAGVGLWWRRRHAAPTFAAGTLLAYGALSLTDYQLDLPVFAFALGTLVALGAQRDDVPATPTGRRTTLVLALAGAAALVAYGVAQVQPLRARGAFAWAVDALSDGDRAAFESGMEEVYRLAPANAFYRNLHACLLADIRAYPTWFPPIDLGPDRLARADAQLWRSLAIDPRQEMPYTHLAWHAVESHPAAALVHFRAAARLIPDKGGLYFGQAQALLRLGRPTEAVNALAMELINDPAFVASPEWARLAEGTELAAQARRAAAATLERIVATAPPADPLGYVRRARYSAALLGWLNGDDTALEVALGVAEPQQQEMLRWLGSQPVERSAERTQPWHYLAEAAAHPEKATASISARYPRIGPTSDALQEMAAALIACDRRSLLKGELVLNPSNQPRIYRERMGYPLLLRNLDAPAPRDPYLIPLNRLVRDFLSPLFPEKGYLPGPVLTRAQADLGIAPAEN